MYFAEFFEKGEYKSISVFFLYQVNAKIIFFKLYVQFGSFVNGNALYFKKKKRRILT